MNKSKILIVIPSTKIGGAEQVLLQIANYYKNYTIELFFFKIHNNLDQIHIPEKSKIIYNKFGNNFFLSLFYFCYYQIKYSTNYDRVFSSHIHINSILGVFRYLKILKTKYLICRESTNIFKRDFGLKKYIFFIMYFLGYKYIDILIVQSLEMKTSIEINLNNKIINHNKIFVLNNPTSFNINYNCSNINLELQKPFFVAAGRFIFEKGFDILLNSFSLILKLYPNYKLYILGEGKLVEEIKQQVIDLNISKSVILTGYTKDVYCYFKYANTCVISSRIEGFPNVLLQMMTVNSNIVSTICTDKILDVPGILKCQPNSVDSLYNSLLESILKENDNFLIISNFLKDNIIDNFITKLNSKLEEK
jgi:glycosyltransferase involved in cell wall biosynthesis